MGLTIALFVWGGKKADEYFENRVPIATIILSLFGIGASLYIVVKDAKRKI
jgi:hypothetical protein